MWSSADCSASASSSFAGPSRTRSVRVKQIGLAEAAIEAGPLDLQAEECEIAEAGIEFGLGVAVEIAPLGAGLLGRAALAAARHGSAGVMRGCASGSPLPGSPSSSEQRGSASERRQYAPTATRPGSSGVPSRSVATRDAAGQRRAGLRVEHRQRAVAGGPHQRLGKPDRLGIGLADDFLFLFHDSALERCFSWSCYPPIAPAAASLRASSAPMPKPPRIAAASSASPCGCLAICEALRENRGAGAGRSKPPASRCTCRARLCGMRSRLGKRQHRRDAGIRRPRRCSAHSSRDCCAEPRGDGAAHLVPAAAVVLAARRGLRRAAAGARIRRRTAARGRRRRHGRRRRSHRCRRRARRRRADCRRAGPATARRP